MPTPPIGPKLSPSGLVINTRYRFDEIPPDVRATTAPLRLSDLPKGPNGVRLGGPRPGRDHATYWCRTCETPVDSQTTSLCDACAKERNADARRAARQADRGLPASLELPMRDLNELVDLVDAVVDRVGAATIEFDRPHMEGGAIDELMLATKALVRFVTENIRPDVLHARHKPATLAEAKARQTAARRRDTT